MACSDSQNHKLKKLIFFFLNKKNIYNNIKKLIKMTQNYLLIHQHQSLNPHGSSYFPHLLDH